MLDELADPRRVGDVGLWAGIVVQMLGVEQPAFEVAFQGVEDGPPLDAGGLHADVRDRVALEPVEQQQQAPRGGGKVWVS